LSISGKSLLQKKLKKYNELKTVIPTAKPSSLFNNSARRLQEKFVKFFTWFLTVEIDFRLTGKYRGVSAFKNAPRDEHAQNVPFGINLLNAKSSPVFATRFRC